MIIAIKRTDGGVSIMRDIVGSVEEVITQWEASSGFEAAFWHEINENDLPDRAFRDQWDTDGSSVFINQGGNE